MPDAIKPTSFSAADAAMGYLYQVRSALLWALQRVGNDLDFVVSIETLDDVTFQTGNNSATDLLQTKHHLKRQASLTDSSPDLWKSLRVWFEGYNSKEIPHNATLHLISTANAPKDSAAFLLRVSAERHIEKAMESLDGVARTSSNETNKKAYEVYLGASQEVRASILNRVVVFDDAPTVHDLGSELRKEVYWACQKEHHVAFLERLEGWWFHRVLKQFKDPERFGIRSAEIEAKMGDLREQFKEESLPIDSDLRDFNLDDATVAAHKNNTFVKQLNVIGVKTARIRAAIRDYYKASQQRSRWVRHIMNLDLQRYDKRLEEEWELVFGEICDELDDTATDMDRKESGRRVLAWANKAHIPIRTNVVESFIFRGSLHILSDEARIGWHPEFREIFSSLTSSKGGGS